MIYLQPNFTPANLYGGIANYDASITPVGAVASWTDQFGNIGAATQAVSGQRPVCTTNQQNGKNGLVFTGASSQTLAIPSGIYGLANGPNTSFIVGKRATVSGNIENLYSLSVTGTGTNRLVVRFSNTNERTDFFNSFAGTLVSQNNTTTNMNIHRTRRLGTTQAISINNAAETTSSTATDETGVDAAYIGSRLGNAQFLTGVICEIVIYNRSLSTIELLWVTQYLSQKWGVAIS